MSNNIAVVLLLNTRLTAVLSFFYYCQTLVRGMMQEKEQKRSAGAHLALSGIQEEAVNRAFEKLFGYPWGTHFALHHGETSDSKLSSSRQENILCEIFGPETAAQILLKNPTLQKKEIKVVRKPQYYKTSKPSTSSTVPQPALSAAFKSQAVTAPRKGGVQNLLQELSGPQTITTVAKTHADWGQFKEQTGLGDKLEEQAESKAAFLKRQDFLGRVDHRKFELEKKDRERERMQRK